MSEAVYPLMFWGALPVLAAHARNWNLLALCLASGLLAFSLSAEFFGQMNTLQSAAQMAFFLLTAAVPLVFMKALRDVRRESFVRLSRLKNERDQRRAELDAVNAEAESLGKTLERLENRFSLIHALATKIDAADILATLGSTWKAVPGVRSCLLMRCSSQGEWEAVYPAGTAAGERLAHAFKAHPEITQSNQIRSFSPGDKNPLFKELASSEQLPFLLVPMAWEKDALAVARVEVEPSRLNDCAEELGTGRRLVSLSLRKAALFDLMKERSRTDPLTGVFLRRVLLERLREALQKVRRYKTRFFLALLDVDFFKRINDERGHLAGDNVLSHLASVARELATPEVILARYGGDEMALLLEMTDRQEAEAWLEKLRATVEQRVDGPRYTVSVGLASCDTADMTPEALIDRADQALYEAKRTGRNRVVVREN